MTLDDFWFWFLETNVCWNFPDVEWVSIRYRTLSALLMGLDGTVGTWILVGFAYGVNEWRMLILAVTSPLILSVGAWWYLTFTFYSFFGIKWWISFVATETETGHILVSCARWLPESARWLLANGKTQDAHQYIMKCAKMNNREEEMKNLTQEVHFHSVCFFSSTISSNDIWTRKRMTSLIIFRPSISQTLIDEPKEEKNNGTNKNYTFIDIFRTPNIRKLSIYLGLVW